MPPHHVVVVVQVTVALDGQSKVRKKLLSLFFLLRNQSNFREHQWRTKKLINPVILHFQH